MLCVKCCSCFCVCNSGNNKKLKLTGRPSDVAGVLATGKLYTLGEQVLAFFPQVCYIRIPLHTRCSPELEFDKYTEKSLCSKFT